MSSDDSDIPLSDHDEPILVQESEEKAPSFAGKRAFILRQVANYEFYGIYDEDIVEQLAKHFESTEAFSPAVRKSITPRPKDDSIRSKLLKPPCFEQFKVPKVTGLASKRQQSFEKPLFERATNLRDILVPLTAASLLVDDDPEVAKNIIDFLLEDLTREFQKVNFQRVVAITPDPDVRKALSLGESHALLDLDVQDNLKNAKKLAKTFEKKRTSPATHQEKRSFNQHRNTNDHPYLPPVSPPSSSSTTHPGSKRGNPSTRSRGGQTRGGRPTD